MRHGAHARGTSVRWAWLLLFLVMPVVLAPVPGPAQPAPQPDRRIALVIGIGTYQSAPALANPVNDARAIGEALRRLNFEVDEVFDPDFRKLTRAVREFGIKAQKADVTVVYYAGHGVQVGRENYLLPADARLERERDLLYEALPLELVLGEASQARKIGIVLLDACRNNPFVDRMSRSMTIAGRGSASPGLARVDNVPRNTMVVMATKADQIAEDGGGDHSPFADALLAHFQIPGLELSLFFRSLRDTVLRATGNRQEPYIFSSLGAEPFYFYPRPPNRPPVLASIPALELRDSAGPTALPIARPTDPDQDPLSVRITGLPRSGEVRVEGRPVAPGAVYAADRFATATYKPDGAATGPVGTLDILVEDGRGGSAMGSLAITVLPSNRPPLVETPRKLRIYTGGLEIARPEDPDGDRVSVLIRSLPRGILRNGAAVLRGGERLRPEELAGLVYVPEPGFGGPAGSLVYQAEDSRGGRAEGTLEIEVMDAAEAAAQLAETALWERLRSTGRVEDVEAFLRLYPDSRFAASAQRRLAELRGPAEPGRAPGGAAAPLALAVPTPTPAPAPPARVPAAPAAAAEPVQAAPRAGADRLAGLQGRPGTEPRAMPAPPPATAGGKYFQDCPTCPWMVRLPAGTLQMGHGAHDAAARPVRAVTLRGFALGQYPVTVAEWKACAAQGGCGALPRLMLAEDSTPLHNVSWEDAQQYIAWLSKVTGRAYRLPSEAEWEYAARAGTQTRYWWGDQLGIGLANCADCGGTQDPRGPMPVDSFQPNAFGLHGMLGGVAQWVQDCWVPTYAGAPNDGSAREQRGCMRRVLRGGSYRSGRDEILPVARNFYDAPVRYQANGFRVARNLD
ncbi:SUMF1/EgtB/PvdO family nonheme iron enzyme [Roseicella sp. DB1501]|uniref:SUMF1/EgtB/PvdO family nonheme iron enzyme n=1 Tax=Roseicella sp. DB1501 TaxID=2730925 RepID=UPI001490CE99|nr:SUMF1/EgtB/PvdO family nonheme iron enzyme [Roseicella sp. DB1501]NOG71806.1 SUMF1/EgtB/PvdO family nonheme iron enzyme [Roseicella sp. DB1501]